MGGSFRLIANCGRWLGLCAPATSNHLMWPPLGEGCNFVQVSSFNARESPETDVAVSYQQQILLEVGGKRVLVLKEGTG